jgi:E3 SUMO-protein ligase PIAS1
MIVNLVEVTSVEQLVDRLKKGKYKSSNEILAKSKTEATCPTGTYLV